MDSGNHWTGKAKMHRGASEPLSMVLNLSLWGLVPPHLVGGRFTVGI